MEFWRPNWISNGVLDFQKKLTHSLLDTTQVGWIPCQSIFRLTINNCTLVFLYKTLVHLFEAKIANGNGEQSLSRDIYRLGHRFDFFRMLSCYFTTVDYYFSTMVINALQVKNIVCWIVMNFQLIAITRLHVWTSPEIRDTNGQSLQESYSII